MANDKFVWAQNGPIFTKQSAGINIMPVLPQGLYRPSFNPDMGWYLECIGSKFEFPFKVYGIEQDFINHVMQWWEVDNRNLGILLNGLKGTGKTVTGKIIANATGLPIIMVDRNMDGLVPYLSGINFPCVIFFDEYEKVFGDKHVVLTLMDGMLSEISRKMFILTTNSRYINDNMLSRPSRIRYFKEFGNLNRDVVIEYLKDSLIDKTLFTQVADFINSLSISTVDILRAVVDEVNIFGFDTNNLTQYLNLEQSKICYHYYMPGFDSNGNPLTNAQFIENCSLIGTPGLDEDGEPTKRRDIYDLFLVDERRLVSVPFSDWKVGQSFPINPELVISEIDGNYVKYVDPKEPTKEYIIKILNPDAGMPTIYGYGTFNL